MLIWVRISSPTALKWHKAGFIPLIVLKAYMGLQMAHMRYLESCQELSWSFSLHLTAWKHPQNLERKKGERERDFHFGKQRVIKNVNSVNDISYFTVLFGKWALQAWRTNSLPINCSPHLRGLLPLRITSKWTSDALNFVLIFFLFSSPYLENVIEA